MKMYLGTYLTIDSKVKLGNLMKELQQLFPKFGTPTAQYSHVYPTYVYLYIMINGHMLLHVFKLFPTSTKGLRLLKNQLPPSEGLLDSAKHDTSHLYKVLKSRFSSSPSL